MLTIRMQRTGRKNDPHFRVIVTDSKRSPKTGNYVENIGFYNPKAGEFKIDADRAKHWLKVGAKTSDTVHNFLVSQKIIEGKKVNVLSKKSPTKKRKELKAAK